MTDLALITVVTYLLSVYPGEKEHTSELLLLPGRLNRLKSLLFNVDAKNVLAVGTGKNPKPKPFHQRVDEMWEVVLLVDVGCHFRTLFLADLSSTSTHLIFRRLGKQSRCASEINLS
jgi:hypothetical protein